jgi:hypothetical protein
MNDPVRIIDAADWRATIIASQAALIEHLSAEIERQARQIDGLMAYSKPVFRGGDEKGQKS